MIHGRRALRQALMPALLSWLAVSAHAAALPAGPAQAPPSHSGPAVTASRSSRPAAAAASRWRDTLRSLLARVAPALVRGEPFTVVVEPAGLPASNGEALQAEVVSQLRARGVRPGGSEAGTRVIVSCVEHTSDRLCAAQIVRGEQRTIFLASRPDEAPPADTARPMLTTLSLRPVLARPQPILDIALLDESRLLVLGTDGLTPFEKRDGAWMAGDRQPIDIGGPWPRDPRGRLVVRDNHLQVFVPGRTCEGTAVPLSVACTDAGGAWPLPIENEGLARGRNYFTSARTVPFYAAVSLADSGGPPLLAAGTDGRLRFLDGDRATLADVSLEAGDLVALGGPCAVDGRLVLASVGADAGPASALQLFDVDVSGLEPLDPPLAVAGRVVALWPTADASVALLVSRHPRLDRYEAFLVSLSCAR